MKILVCGGRNYDNYPAVDKLLTAYKDRIDLIIEGGASGADTLAKVWAVKNKIKYQEFKADWSIGKQAGFLRNKRMLIDGKPDLVIAFPGGSGTADMIKQSQKFGLPVIYAV